MADNNNNKKRIDLIASDFFDYLGRHLPQECASDEFYFIPRSEIAIQHLDILDDLSPEKIRGHVQYVRELIGKIPSEESAELEEEIDRTFLRQSMKGFIREFEDAKVWQNDPTLYVKIPLFATDHILSQGNRPADQIKSGLLSLFRQIPSFLNLAIRNIHLPSEISSEVSLDMARDAIHFFKNDISAFIMEKVGEDEALLSKLSDVLESWEQFSKELLQVPVKESFAIGEHALKEILSVSLGYPRNPGEILEYARDSYKLTMERIRTLAREIDSNKKWSEIIYEKTPSVDSPEDLLQLFKNAVTALRKFFREEESIIFPPGEELQVLKTPPYLQSLRATASYKAPLTGDTTGHGIFYITPGQEDLGLIACHSQYLPAHETYPGHHILDHIRIHHPNPIRRQIESPLYYEGWACYAEQLLDELGYIIDPRQKLIGLKRQLWRSLRAVLDMELHMKKISFSQAAEQIRDIGFSKKRSRHQVRRFALTPVYQSCYSMGMHEIIDLKKRFSPGLGRKAFHDILLGGGQLPFHLVEKRLEATESE